MSELFYVLCVALLANAAISFFIAFFWQAKVILTIFGVSDGKNGNISWKGLSDPWKGMYNKNSPQNNFLRFFAGEIFPDLRRKWLKAIAYVAISYVTLFAVVGLLQIISPESLRLSPPPL